MTTPLDRRKYRLGFLLLPFLAACGNDRAPAPAAPLTAEQKDREELSRQPKEDWTPSNTPHKLNILFLLDKNRIRKGEVFRYRLEMRNLGQEPLAFRETDPSFVKEGSLCGDSAFKLYATLPGGKERLLPCKPEEKAAVGASTAPAGEMGSGLDLVLRPGEYLLTRGSSSKDHFRELRTKFSFAALGTYTLKAVYAPAGGFRAVSNTVTLEVVP